VTSEEERVYIILGTECFYNISGEIFHYENPCMLRIMIERIISKELGEFLAFLKIQSNWIFLGM